MNRIPIFLSTLSCLVAGTSLWLSSGATSVAAADLHRMDTERGLLARSVRDLERRLAALQADPGAAALESPPQPTRAQSDPVPDGSASAGVEGGAPFLAALGDAPADAADLLRRFRDLSEKEREDALKELGKLAEDGDARALELVLDGLGDPSAEVRERAARILGDLGDPAWLESLRAAAGDPSSDVRTAVARSLEKLPADAAGPVLVDMLRDGDPEVVDEAIKALAKLDYREARPRLMDQLRTEDLDVATRAASALRAMGDEGSVQGTVERILADYRAGGTEERLADVNRLRRIGGAAAIAELRLILESDPSLSVRDKARQALIKLGQ